MGRGNERIRYSKKMVELTRELFKEKSTVRKEELKAQIVMLKGMLGKGEGAVVAPASVAVLKSEKEEKKLKSRIKRQGHWLPCEP